jgi:hypothetical protein
LVVGKYRSRFTSPGHGFIEVLDGDVEMRRHVLLLNGQSGPA